MHLDAVKLFLKSNRTVLLLAFSSSLFSSLLTALILKATYKPPQILTLDLKSIIREELAQDIKEKTPEEIERRFKEVLEKNLRALEQLTHRKKVIVFSKEAVLKGGQDITKYFASPREEKE